MGAMLAKIVNLALLGLFPLAWQAPLARAEATWLFYSEEITIIQGVRELAEKDIYLSALVGFFAIAMPYVKTLALVYVQFSESEPGRKMLPILEVMGKLSMTDVFLIALYIVAYRGIGDIVVDWGLYFFTTLVLLSMWASWQTKYALRKARAGG